MFLTLSPVVRDGLFCVPGESMVSRDVRVRIIRSKDLKRPFARHSFYFIIFDGRGVKGFLLRILFVSYSCGMSEPQSAVDLIVFLVTE